MRATGRPVPTACTWHESFNRTAQITNSTEAEELHRGSRRARRLISLIVGAFAGAIGTLFQVSLERADGMRHAFIAWAHTHHVMGFVLVRSSAAAVTAPAAWLVRRFAPEASGSGIPHCRERAASATLPPAPLVLIPVKFIGGVLAIGAGLALGREGPTVQMGASIAHGLGMLLRRNAEDCRVSARGRRRGLATAFNAPIAGGVSCWRN